MYWIVISIPYFILASVLVYLVIDNRNVNLAIEDSKKFRVVEDKSISDKDSRRYFAQVYDSKKESWSFIVMDSNREASLISDNIEQSQAISLEDALALIESYKIIFVDEFDLNVTMEIE